MGNSPPPPLIGLRDEDVNINIMVTTYNTTVTDVVSDILGNGRRRKTARVARDVLDLCGERKIVKKKRKQKEQNKEKQTGGLRSQCRNAKEDLEEIETCLSKNNRKKACQLVE